MTSNFTSTRLDTFDNEPNGFVKCNTTKIQIAFREHGVDFFDTDTLTEEDKVKEWEIMAERGLIADREQDIYIRDGFGAYMGNILVTEDQSYEYMISKRYSKYVEQGYILAKGPAGPANPNKSSEVYPNNYGVYCLNYQDFLEMKNTAKRTL